MKFADRVAATNLEAIMDRHDKAVQRTLADLKTAGFRENTIDAAYQRLDAQREFAGFTQDQIDQALYAMRKRARERNEQTRKTA